jgi:acyl-CoA hydrolase
MNHDESSVSYTILEWFSLIIPPNVPNYGDLGIFGGWFMAFMALIWH